MTYVMIAVFQIEELPDVIREFVSSGMVKSVKPAYERGVAEVKAKRPKAIAGHDRELILEFIRDKGDVGYDDIICGDLQITDSSIAYNLKILIKNGDLVRIGEKPYRYKVAEGA